MEADLQDRGVDVGDHAIMKARSWRWLRVRIAGLLSVESRLSSALAPKDRTGGRRGAQRR